MDIRQDLNIYVLEAEYLTSDAGDYGITLNRIIAQMGATGGKILLGTKDYKISTTVNINKNLTLQGNGASDFYSKNWQSAFWTDSATLKLFTVNSVVKVVIEDIHFYNSLVSTPTAGCAIQLAGVAGTEDLNKIVMSTEINRCSFNGFYDHIFANGACQWGISNSIFHGHERYAVYVSCIQWEDAGDSRIIGCDFYGKRANRTSLAHVRQVGSGGLKILGNKFNDKATKAIDMFFNLPIAHGTSVSTITGNSFENYRERGINIESASGSARFSLISITGNEFASYSANNAIDISVKNCNVLSITGNVFRMSGTLHAINLNTVNNATLLNTYEGFSNPLNIYASTNVKSAFLQDAVGTNSNI